MDVAITGAAGYFGQKIISLMEKDDFYNRIIGISRREWRHGFKKLEYHRMDVRSKDIKNIFEGVDAIIHLAFVVSPIHSQKEMYDIDINGTKNVIRAGVEAGVKKFVITSSTMVYGAWEDNPEWLKEEDETRGHPTYYYNKHKIMVEKIAKEMLGKELVILRPCLVVGQHVKHFYVDLLNMPFLPLVDGRNPRMQFVHEDDVARAYDIVLKKNAKGIFNIVGEGVIRWKELIEMAGKHAIKMPSWLIKSMLKIAWKLHATKFPPEIIDFVTYEWVASGEKAKHELGFIPQYSSKEAVESYLNARQRNYF